MSHEYFADGVIRPLDDGIAPMIAYSHYGIHRGAIFTATKNVGSVAHAGTASFAVVPGSHPAHIIFTIHASGDYELYMSEGGTLAGGTIIPSVNRNRISTNVSETVVTYGGTVTGGTPIGEDYVSGSGIEGETGGVLREENEWVINKMTSIDIVNTTGGAIKVGFAVNWYERTHE